MTTVSTITAWLFSEGGLTAIVSVLGTLYLLMKKKEIDGVKVEWNKKVALDSLYVGVLQAFQQYVKGMKEQDPNGKVNSEVETKAHEMATAIGTEVAAKKGVDLKATVGEDFIDYNIKKIVEDLKTKGIIPTSKEIKG
jgi:hypothetical protein